MVSRLLAITYCVTIEGSKLIIPIILRKYYKLLRISSHYAKIPEKREKNDHATRNKDDVVRVSSEKATIAPLIELRFANGGGSLEGC